MSSLEVLYELCCRLPPTSGISRCADIADRSIHIHGLPLGIQEGLLQQALKKLSKGMHWVEVFMGASEAIVELDTPCGKGVSKCTQSDNLKMLAHWHAPTDEKL